MIKDASDNDVTSNYAISYVKGELEVTQASLSVTVVDNTKVYGAADPEFTVTYAGFIDGEDATDLGGELSFTREEGEDVGKYAITPSGLTSDNYAITFVDGDLAITKAPLTITANNDSKFVTQDDTEGYAGVKYAGFKFGENKAVLDTTNLTIVRTNAGVKQAGEYAAVLVTSGVEAQTMRSAM